ncbi:MULTISPECIES: hypothetical protein [unclassified Bartonella]|uniref:hypothetical protein n=1 Tax=unclassified Bartonella TaxID=2645622 RepID=UPI0021C78277|nr:MULTISPECIES: hypothetical protein [unclassified Bartonella]UXN03204.1 hypothetical protein N6B01_12175 [Bartonella sp. HY406]UXN06167.1 hypothetical protein N6A79_12915 [Bartonella sp. HY761]
MFIIKYLQYHQVDEEYGKDNAKIAINLLKCRSTSEVINAFIALLNGEKFTYFAEGGQSKFGTYGLKDVFSDWISEHAEKGKTLKILINSFKLSDKAKLDGVLDFLDDGFFSGFLYSDVAKEDLKLKMEKMRVTVYIIH